AGERRKCRKAGSACGSGLGGLPHGDLAPALAPKVVYRSACPRRTRPTAIAVGPEGEQVNVTQLLRQP
ncbi:MAG: hypothetical protein ACK559_15505, partial [bacterium]